MYFDPLLFCFYLLAVLPLFILIFFSSDSFFSFVYCFALFCFITFFFFVYSTTVLFCIVLFLVLYLIFSRFLHPMLFLFIWQCCSFLPFFLSYTHPSLTIHSFIMSFHSLYPVSSSFFFRLFFVASPLILPVFPVFLYVSFLVYSFSYFFFFRYFPFFFYLFLFIFSFPAFLLFFLPLHSAISSPSILSVSFLAQPFFPRLFLPPCSSLPPYSSLPPSLFTHIPPLKAAYTTGPAGSDPIKRAIKLFRSSKLSHPERRRKKRRRHLNIYTSSRVAAEVTII